MGNEWYYEAMGEVFGPFDARTINRLAVDGHITPEVVVRKGSEGKWYLAGQVKGLFKPMPPATKKHESIPDGNLVHVPSSQAETEVVSKPSPENSVSHPTEPDSPSGNLRSCPDCAKQVSKRAQQCPHCGCPLDMVMPDVVEAERLGDGTVLTNMAPPLLLAAIQQVFFDFGAVSVDINESDLSVVAETGASWLSYGQTIIGTARQDAEGWVVFFDSQAHSQLIDWGRGECERNQLAELLVALLRAQT